MTSGRLPAPPTVTDIAADITADAHDLRRTDAAERAELHSLHSAATDLVARIERLMQYDERVENPRHARILARSQRVSARLEMTSPA